VCIDYGVAAYANPAALRLFHYEKGQWVDRTVSVDTRTRRVCGSVTSLSPFALAEPIAIEGRMHGEAEIHAGGREYEVRFRIAEGRIGSERGSLALRVRTPTHGRGAAQVDRFETTAIEALVFWDDPAFVAGRTKQPRPPADSAIVTGSGRWNGVDGHTFVARAVDQGEPGRGRDRFAITVRAPSGAVVAEVDAAIDKGNIQSDRLDRRHWR
jgi:PAS domain-containing protein